MELNGVGGAATLAMAVMSRRRHQGVLPHGLFILWASVGMALTLLGWLGYWVVEDPGTAKALAAVLVVHIFGGRAAGIGLCILNQFSPGMTIGYNFYLEVLIVTLSYSLFVLSRDDYIRVRWLRYSAIRLERKARAHKESIVRYGWLGLFIFVMAPLPVTGPVMGSIIGSLLRFRTWKNFSATFLGTLVAIVIWTFFFDLLEQHLHVIRYVMVAIIVMVLACYVKTIRKFLAG